MSKPDDWRQHSFPSEDVGPFALLLGNGINRASEAPSWESLIRALHRLVTQEKPLPLDTEKPFPLLYEELYLHGKATAFLDEEHLLALIGDAAQEIRGSSLHLALGKLPVRHIMTTNYDQAIIEGFLGTRTESNDAPVQESKYSLFRRAEREGRVVWRIHGAQEAPRTIVLGYEHYGSYLAQVRNYVSAGVEYQKRKLRSLAHRRSTQEARVHSWVDLLLLSNVVILGLELDFVEMHLWWLLSYRARHADHGTKWPRRMVVYMMPDGALEPRQKRKIELLRAAGVTIDRVPFDGDWKAFYRRAFTRISSLPDAIH